MKIMRYLLGLAFGSAGILHFTNERQFRSIVPEITITKTAVLVTGVFEMFFGVMLLAKRPADWLKKVLMHFTCSFTSKHLHGKKAITIRK